jgi:hypothetical protein
MGTSVRMAGGSLADVSACGFQRDEEHATEAVSLVGF